MLVILTFGRCLRLVNEDLFTRNVPQANRTSAPVIQNSYCNLPDTHPPTNMFLSYFSTYE